MSEKQTLDITSGEMMTEADQMDRLRRENHIETAERMAEEDWYAANPSE